MLIAKAPSITILVACLDENGVLRFPSDEGVYFGITGSIDHTLAISKQAIAYVEAFLAVKAEGNWFEPLSIIEPVLRSEGQDPSLLYLLRSDREFIQAPSHWKRIVDVLRELPAGSNRVAYNKAFQYFAGAAEQEVSILEMDGEVQQRLLELMGESSRLC